MKIINFGSQEVSILNKTKFHSFFIVAIVYASI